MLRTKFRLELSILRLLSLAALPAAFGLLHAAEVSQVTSVPPTPPKINARFISDKTASDEEVTRGILVAETNQFSFVLPHGFRCQVDGATKKLAITSSDYGCTISAVIHEAALEGKVDLKPDTVRSQVLARFPGGRITDEFNASIQSMSGPGFEVRWISSASVPTVSRVAFVPYQGGHIEFTFQTTEENFSTYEHALNHLLLSFRSSPVGQKLEMQELLSEL